MEDLYKTSDYYIATVLVAKGYNTVKHDSVNGKVIWFFDNIVPVQAIVKTYMTGTLVIPVKDVFNAQRFLKTHMHDLSFN
jgi:hypothetical protein